MKILTTEAEAESVEYDETISPAPIDAEKDKKATQIMKEAGFISNTEPAANEENITLPHEVTADREKVAIQMVPLRDMETAVKIARMQGELDAYRSLKSFKRRT